MNYTKINNAQILTTLKQTIDSKQSGHILLEQLRSAVESLNTEMPAFLQSSEGQAILGDALDQLISQQIITPVGKPNVRGLYRKYKVNKRPAAKDSSLMTRIIKSIAPPATLDYYLKNPQDYINDCEIIEVIMDSLKQEHQESVTVNERAYQLFGDEKFFKGASKNRSRGDTILKRLGLTYANLACAEVVEPFFSFQKPEFYSLKARSIFIIENKDTFWSFKRRVMDLPSNINVDMLIYGEGKKILSSFQFVQEYGISSLTDLFFYFGDLDAEGINIYCELLAKYPRYKICPFQAGYLAVLEIGLSKEPVKTPAAQKINHANIAGFSNAFVSARAEQIKEHLERGFYIPQEALSAAEMKERFGKTSHV